MTDRYAVNLTRRDHEIAGEIMESTGAASRPEVIRRALQLYRSVLGADRIVLTDRDGEFVVKLPEAASL